MFGIDDNIVNINWGRIVYNGRSKSYQCNTYEEALKFANTKIDEKTKKGYWKYPIEKITSHSALEYL